LFATVYGFQDLARKVSAVQLVELLSQIFLEFDQLIEKYGVEKVNTLGANYVAATGIGESKQPDHAALARLAIGMREVVTHVSASVKHPFSLRIGMSTGQVVSGVIGDARPSFDIWGETVELANSLRGSAMANSIVINEASYWRLRDQFEVEAMQGDQGRFLLHGEAR
jgi:class 3 adenylate cyclase